MNVLRFRRDRRQRDPFAGTPLDREPATQTMPAAAPDYASRIDVQQKAAEIAWEAIRQCEEERERLRPPGTSADPRSPQYVPGPVPVPDFSALEQFKTAHAPWGPAAETAVPDLTAEDAHALYGWDITAMDNPPVHHRPYVPEPPLPPMPFSGVSSIWVSQIDYPAPGDLSIDAARNYARTLRHIGLATGTRGLLESEAAWPRPALETGAAA